MKKNSLLFAAIVCMSFSFSNAAESQAHSILTNMLSAVQKHKGAQFMLRTSERLNGKKELNVTDIFTKVNVEPNKIYAKIIAGKNAGTELLYVKGERDNKIFVNAGKLIPNLKLNPTSNLLTKDQRHCLLSTGFMTVYRILGDAVKRAEAQNAFDQVFKYEGEIVWNSRKCHKITATDPTYNLTTYVGKPGETVFSLGQKLLVSEYAIIELNASASHLDDNLNGKSIKIPTSYAKKTVLYIDQETNMPVYQEMSDDKGIFERYEYTKVVLNPAYKANEFTSDFPEYKF